MLELGPLHPQIVHFVVALGFLGVILRLVSLTGRLAWTRPAATALLLIAAAASVGAVRSGVEAHGPAERVPGARPVVQEHEELGEKTRNVFLAVAALEVAALALRRRERVQRGLLLASGLVGVVACYFLYEAAEHGGELVYSYAGGVGTRSGDPADVRRLLVAGLYHEARVARDAGRPDEAARLIGELAMQMPGDTSVALLAIESMIRDRRDAAGALAALALLSVPPDNPRLVVQKGVLEGQALAAAGQVDSARAVLQRLAQRFPQSRLVADELAKLR
ncbi:MAG: DUF2231 domain-containing protein [Gemmatimonadota bacterium]